MQAKYTAFTADQSGHTEKIGYGHINTNGEIEITLYSFPANGKFTLTDDNSRVGPPYRYGTPLRYVQDALEEWGVEQSDPVATYVGPEAFQKAGGFLYMGAPSEEFFLDPLALGRMAYDKLENEVQELQQLGWGLINTALDTPLQHEEISRSNPLPAEYSVCLSIDEDGNSILTAEQKGAGK